MLWTQPDAVGVAVDPTFSNDEPWGIGEWIFYSAQLWLPGLLSLFALMSLWGRFITQKHRQRNAGVVSTLLRTGTLTESEVLKAPLPVPNTSRMAASFTVKFQDSNSDDRWGTCSAILPPSDVPAVGSLRPLLYDTQHPGDTKWIFFSPGGGTSVGDFHAVAASH